MKISTLVKNNTATFSFYRNGNLFYDIVFNGNTYEFPIPIYEIKEETVTIFEDTKDGGFTDEVKALHLTRWIRKAIDNETFLKTD